jgi:hypothetical protein
MPITRTRAIRAAELLKRLETGPAFSSLEWTHDFSQPPKKPEQIATESYRRWADSWILDELRELVPELRKTKAGS